MPHHERYRHHSACTADELLTERELSKLHWRCRRGPAGERLFIEQFFKRFEPELKQRHAQGWLLMDLADNDLLDLLLCAAEPDARHPPAQKWRCSACCA